MPPGAAMLHYAAMSKWAAEAAVLLGFLWFSAVTGTPVNAQPAKPAPAGSESQPKSVLEYQAAVVAAYEQGKLSRALRLAKAGIAAFPDDAGLHHRYGVVLTKVVELDRARHHLERARKTLTKDAELLIDLGWVYLAQGEAAKAEAVVKDAVALDPQNARAAELAFNLTVQARIRSKQPLPLDKGSAAAFVAAFLKRIEGGDLRGAVDQDVERAAIDRIVRGTGGNPAVGRDRVLRGFTRGLGEAWKQFFGKRGNRYEGFDVQPEAEVEGDVHRVILNVLMRRALDAKQVAQTRKFAANPKFARYIDAETLAIIRGLEGPDLDRFFDRIVGQSTAIFVGIEVLTVKDAGGNWKVRDVLIGNPPVAFSKLPGIYRDAAKEGLVPKRRTKKNLPYRIGYLTGLLFLIGGVLLVLRRLRR